MGRILPERWRNAVAELCTAIAPSSCLLCAADSSETLCPGCAAELPLLPQGCPQCAEPTTHGERCGRCLHEPPHFDAAFAIWRYEFPLDRLIHAYKYGGELALSGWFGKRLAEKLHAWNYDLIVPMPLHRDRLRERGFNQAAELARVIGLEKNCPLSLDQLRRTRATAAQADLPLAQRAANVRGAFECAGDWQGKRLLLVDDVMTSGATLSECARILKLHGASAVGVAVVARAVHR